MWSSDPAESVWPTFLCQKVSSAVLTCTSCSLQSLQCARKDFSGLEDSQQDTRSCALPKDRIERKVSYKQAVCDPTVFAK